MLDVFFTVDTEVWCENWQNIDQQFPAAYQRYIQGPTPKGDYGLPYQLKVLRDYGLLGVFFVEPLFAAHFGIAPLQEIVGMVAEAGHEVQLHLHPEWTDEAIEPLLPNVSGKRQHLFMYSREEQTALIAAGLRLLRQAGVVDINAFRAGSFGFNHDTLFALAANGITFDSSYNALLFGPQSGVYSGQATVNEPFESEGVIEYPMTVYMDGLDRLRHTQLTACSSAELESLLWQALEQERKSFVILSHNFELLNVRKTQVDSIVNQRFIRLCEFLQKNSDSFRTVGFKSLTPKTLIDQPALLKVGFKDTFIRLFEQVYRKRYQ